MPDPDPEHIRCTVDGVCESARISGAGWKISKGGQPENFYPRLEFFDWSNHRWAVVWKDHKFQFYDPLQAPNPHHSDDKMQYLGCEPDAHHHAKKWEVTYDERTNKFSHTPG
jgi:hypothetical protein